MYKGEICSMLETNNGRRRPTIFHWRWGAKA